LSIQLPGKPAWAAPLSRCVSGQQDGGLWVTLASEGGPAVTLRIVDKGVDGLEARLSARGAAPAILTRATCRTLAREVRRTGRAVNRVALLEGPIPLDCTAPDGTIVSGVATFDRCH